MILLALGYKAQASFHLNQFADSLDSANKALAIDPSYQVALYCKYQTLQSMANKLISQNKFDQALLCIDMILKIDPNSLQGLEQKFIVLKRVWRAVRCC